MTTATGLRTSARHRFTVRRRRAVILELEDLSFATARAIFLPDPGIDLEIADTQERVTGLAVFAATLAFGRRFPEKELWIAGHTDTTGSHATNDALSESRARNVQLFLEDAHAWADHCDSVYAVDDYQRTLLWVHRTFGWETDPGPIDNDFGDRTRTARDRFRERFNAEFDASLQRHVKQNSEDWRAYAALYDLALGEILNETPDTLTDMRSRLHFTDPAFTGCGERFPRERPSEDGLESAANRRVEIVFFDPGEKPDLPGYPAGAPLYDSRVFLREYLSVEPVLNGGANYRVFVQLYDHWLDRVLPRQEYTLSGPLPNAPVVRTGTTDDEGVLVETELPSGHYTVDVAGGCALALTAFQDPTPGRVEFALALPVDGVNESRGPLVGLEEEIDELEWAVFDYGDETDFDLGTEFEPEQDNDLENDELDDEDDSDGG